MIIKINGPIISLVNKLLNEKQTNKHHMISCINTP